MKFGQEILQSLYGKPMIISKRNFLNYAILILFIAASGVPYLSSPALNVLLFILMSTIFYYRKKHLNMSFLLFCIMLLTITLLQALKFDFISIVTTIGLFTMVINAYFIVKILEKKFISYYVNILYYIAIISFVFFFPFLFLPALGTFFVHSIVPLFSIFNISHSVHETILVYNLSHIDVFRNSGPFWEPGAFAGYLVIAFMLNFINESEIISRKNIVFLIAIFTTFSTTAFLVLFLFFFFMYYKQVKNIPFKILTVVSLLTIAFVSYTSLDFLGNKIEKQLIKETSKDVLYGKSRDTGRFITIIRDMKDFKGHEWIGRGVNNATRFDAPSGKVFLRSVGLTDVLVKFGSVFFIMIIYFLYKSICMYVSTIKIDQPNQLICIGISITILVLLVSEVYFNYPLYWSLLFLGYSYNKEEEVNYI